MIQKTYLILDTGANLIKIGKSCNPASRMKTMQAHNGSILELIHVFPADIEMQLHVKYKDKRKHYEWFDVCADDVVKYVEGDKILLGVIDEQLSKSGKEKKKNSKFRDEAVESMGKLSWIDEIKIGGRKSIPLGDIDSIARNINKIGSQLGKKFKIKGGYLYRIS